MASDPPRSDPSNPSSAHSASTSSGMKRKRKPGGRGGSSRTAGRAKERNGGRGLGGGVPGRKFLSTKRKMDSAATSSVSTPSSSSKRVRQPGPTSKDGAKAAAFLKAVNYMKTMNEEKKRRREEAERDLRRNLDVDLWKSSKGLSSVLDFDKMRFIVSKAPLKPSILQSQSSSFDFNIIEKELEKKGIEVDVFINLTPYKLKILDDSKPALLSTTFHFECPILDEPPKKVYQQFENMLNTYYGNPKNAKKTVVIFDMYGHDIAGYMIVRYLAEVYSVQGIIGLGKFGSVRPPGVRSKSIANALLKTLGQDEAEDQIRKAPRKDAAFRVPQPKERVNFSKGHGSRETSRKSSKMETKDHGIPGHKYLRPVSGAHLDRLRRRMFDLVLKVFGGENPREKLAERLVRKPLSSDYLRFLAPAGNHYELSWLPDAPYVYLLILKEGCFFVTGNDLKLFHVPHFEFRKRKSMADRLGSSLCQGELVLDKNPDGTERPRFFITDFLVMDKTPITEHPHRRRLRIAQVELVDCRGQYISKIPKKPPVSIRIKPMHDISQWKKVLSFRPYHKTLGLVFMARNTPYGKFVEATSPTEILWNPRDGYVSEAEFEKIVGQ